MATAQVQIDRALRILEELEPGATSTALEGSDGLLSLNAMIGAWLADPDLGIVTLVTYATLATDQTLPNGYDEAIVYNLAIRLAPEYKVKVGPEIIQVALKAFQVIRRDVAPAITDTAENVIIKALRLVGAVEINQKPTPKELAYSLSTLNDMIGSWLADVDMETVSLIAYATSSTVQSLPNGYYDALVYNLAVRLAPAYDKAATPDIIAVATSALRYIRRVAAPANTDTAENVIIKALRLVGALEINQKPTPKELAYSLSTLNDMIGGWLADVDMDTISLVAYATSSTVQILPNGYYDALVYNLAVRLAPAYKVTVGPEIIQVALKSLQVIRRDVAPAITGTAENVIIKALRLVGAVEINQKPTPKELAYSLSTLNDMIGSWLADVDMEMIGLVTYATSSTIQSLPNGYFNALVYNLAVRLAPSYEKTATPDIIAVAIKSLQVIRRDVSSAITGTAENVITKALRLVGAVEINQRPTPKELAYSLSTLNDMIGSWLADGDMDIVSLVAYATSSTVQSLPNGYLDALVYNLALRLAPAYEKAVTPDFIQVAQKSLQVISRDVSSAITDTAENVITKALRLVGAVELNQKPTPKELAYSLSTLNDMIGGWLANRDMGIVSLVAYSASSTVQSLPSGYYDALVYNLAVRLAPAYGKVSTPDIIAVATSALRYIRRAAAPAITGTAQKIINRALRLIGQIGPDEISTVTESNYVLDSLNAMYGRWRNEGLMTYAMRDSSIPLVSGNQTRTIGPSGNLITTRPVEIKTAYVVVGTLSYEVKTITAEEYANIALKDLTGAWPFQLYYQPNLPDGKIYLWPVPDASSTLHVIDEFPLAGFTSLTDVLSVQPGMEEAMAFNLAVTIAPEFGKEPSNTVRKLASDSVKVLKRTNNQTPRAYFDPSLYGYRGGVPYYPPYP